MMEGDQNPDCGAEMMIVAVSQQEGSERRSWGCSSGNRRTFGPTRRSTKGQWTADEDEILRKAVEQFKGKSWKKIAECFKNRTDVQCLHRWQKVLNPELVKGPWAKEEDEIIIESVKNYGAKKWSAIAKHLPGRIGKQCRERWHNHLNPAINREAWTQEEELALISAHRSYGNKWAELSKFLPGRTDNAIKNHWNSSVKKRLDSYIAAGLVPTNQFPFLCVKHNDPMQSSSSSSKRQCSGDDNLTTGTEEISECSQCSSLQGYSQQGSDNSNSTMCKTDHDAAEDCCHSPDSRHDGPTVYLGEDNKRYLPSLTASPSIHSLSSPTKVHLPQFPDVSSLELGEEPTATIHSEVMNITISNPLELSTAGSAAMEAERILMSGFESKFSDVTEMVDASVVTEREYVDLSRRDDITTQSNSPVKCDMPDSLVLTEDSTFLFDTKSNHLDIGNLKTDNIHIENDSTKLHDPSLKGKEEHMASFPLSVPSDLSYVMDGSYKEAAKVKNSETGDGGLFYEPPQFPGVEIPFFSCNLIQSGNDTQQEFSPLGIRQLMISSVNCLTPFRLSDSPPKGGTPDAVLRSAAKSFSNTPSILKKRRHDFFSSLDQRREKRLVNEISKELSACNLDMEFEKSTSHRFRTRKIEGESVIDKKIKKRCENQENICPKDNQEKKCSTPNGKVYQVEKEDVLKANPTLTSMCTVAEELHDPVLTAKNENHKLFISPARNGFVGDRVSIFNARAPIKDNRNSDSTVDKISSSDNLVRNHVSVISPRLSCATSCTESDTTTEAKSDMFGGTPFKRGIESPSAWKSPWFINPFIPRMYDVETLSLEEVGFFTSPGDRSYDAIGLMKQLSEHTALTFANAQALLENEPKQNHFTTITTTPPSSECRILDFSECTTPLPIQPNSALP